MLERKDLEEQEKALVKLKKCLKQRNNQVSTGKKILMAKKIILILKIIIEGKE